MKNLSSNSSGFMYVNGMEVSTTGGKNLIINEGLCRDSTNTFDIELSELLSLDVLKIRDIGSTSANAIYAVYVVADSNGYQKTKGIISSNYLSPIIRDGYDKFRRVGFIKLDTSTNVFLFNSFGKGDHKDIYYQNGVEVYDDQSPTSFTAVDLSSIVPPIETDVYFLVKYTPAAAANYAKFISGRVTGNLSAPLRFGYGNQVQQTGSITVPCALINNVPKINVSCIASDVISLFVVGYRDYL